MKNVKGGDGEFYVQVHALLFIQYVGKLPPAQMLSLAGLGKQVQEYVPEDANGEWEWLALLCAQLCTAQMDRAVCEVRINTLQSQIAYIEKSRVVNEK
jgi:hypothetical protein